MMFCKAPSNNIYFTIKGEASPCWLTVGKVDQWSPTHSIKDIWRSVEWKIHQVTPFDKCKICQNNRENGVWALADAYDEFPVQTWPSLMELELSNQCNLECIMCSGLLSSGIRKNRDKLPPLPMIYTPQFVEEMKEFVPYLKELRLNGGEPFAQKIVLDICDMVAEVNPSLKITIATNGTIMNKRVRHIMKRNNLHLNISIDSLNKELYEQIRINGDFDQLIKNFEIFNDYCKENSRELSVMVNPMCNNWFEMAEFVRWTHEYDVNLHFNTIMYPKWLAIWNKGPEWLRYIIDFMEKQRDNPNPKREHMSLTNYSRNLTQYDNLLNQIRNWHLDCLLLLENDIN